MRREADQRRREAEDLEKYGGVRASRKELFGNAGASASEDEGDGSEVDEDEEDGQDDVEDEEDEDEDVPFGQAEDDEASSSDEDAPFTPAAPTAAAPAESLEATQILSSLRQSRSEDVSKGLAVKKQLEFFENVLLVRMKMQKAVVGLGTLKVRGCGLGRAFRSSCPELLPSPLRRRPKPRRSSPARRKRRSRQSTRARRKLRSCRRVSSSCARCASASLKHGRLGEKLILYVFPSSPGPAQGQRLFD
jgi:hypothetical protein